MARNKKLSLSIRWPFIIACIVGYNIFFGDNEKKVDEEIIKEKPSEIVEIDKSSKNKIDEVVSKVKNEIDNSVVIQQAKEQLIKATEKIVTELSEVKKKPEPEIEEKEKHDIQVEKKPEPPPVLEDLKEEVPTSIDNMKSL